LFIVYSYDELFYFFLVSDVVEPCLRAGLPAAAGSARIGELLAK
jgi:hypothetical protein